MLSIHGREYVSPLGLGGALLSNEYPKPEPQNPNLNNEVHSFGLGFGLKLTLRGCSKLRLRGDGILMWR